MNTVVRRAAVAYADAQFDLTGNSYPFGAIKNDDDYDDDEVLAAGRRKFLENRPGESEVNAQSTVSHLGAALYELAHADGWDSLDKAPGLTPLGSAIVAAEQTDQIEFSQDLLDDEEPDRNFAIDGRVLYTEENRYF